LKDIEGIVIIAHKVKNTICGDARRPQPNFISIRIITERKSSSEILSIGSDAIVIRCDLFDFRDEVRRARAKANAEKSWLNVVLNQELFDEISRSELQEASEEWIVVGVIAPTNSGSCVA